MTTSNFSAGRDVAIVGFAQTKHVRSADTLSEVEMIQPVIAEAMNQVGLDHHGFDFYCSGSSDYLAGQAFSFVMTLDAIGAWPPKRDSHVEMDGAWALYEAWLRLQEGDIEIAVVTGSKRWRSNQPLSHASNRSRPTATSIVRRNAAPFS